MTRYAGLVLHMNGGLAIRFLQLVHVRDSRVVLNTLVYVTPIVDRCNPRTCREEKRSSEVPVYHEIITIAPTQQNDPKELTICCSASISDANPDCCRHAMNAA